MPDVDQSVVVLKKRRSGRSARLYRRPDYAGATLDRLFHNTDRVRLVGDSLRRRHAGSIRED
jgi:hypothetical protein